MAHRRREPRARGLHRRRPRAGRDRVMRTAAGRGANDGTPAPSNARCGAVRAPYRIRKLHR
ncbi:hypothetical protein BLAT2472_70247 [Burkholderia latens]